MTEEMKPRKGYKNIIVEDKVYQYTIGHSEELGNVIVVYDQNNLKYLLDPNKIKDHDGRPTWRGKRADKAFGKYEVALAIKQQILQS